MSLSFIYGPAGAGKSTYVQKMLIDWSEKEPKRNFILIVPDQFTMQTQADIVKLHKRNGIMNIDVLSFGRLSYRIFEEMGAPDETILDDTGKSLVIRHVSSSVAEKMPYIGRNLSKTGYVHEVKSSISEFMQYGVGVKELKSFSDKVSSPLLKTKLKDLSVIYEAFQDYNRDKFITGEESLDILCKKIPGSEIIKDSVIVFDGFTGFTPIQERVILTLLKYAAKVYVTLTVSDGWKPGDVIGEERLFYLTSKTARRLITKCEDEKISREQDKEITRGSERRRFDVNSGLSHLEKNLFRYPIVKYDSDVTDVEMFEAENIKTEVDEVCLRILKMVRESDYAYRDIAIVTGNLENYGDLFERRFKELGIPAFIDRTRGIVLNPFTEYLKSAMRILIKDYSYDTVFHFLRSGFTDFDIDEIDRLDSYVRSLNIRGRNAWHKEFKRTRKGLSKDEKDRGLLEVVDRNVSREKLVEMLSCLERPACKGSEYVRNLYDFLIANNSFDKLNAYENYFTERNDLSKAREYAQIYRLIMQLLETINDLVGEEELTPDEFYRIFESGINEITVGTIPQNVDRIVVGDIERTRLKEVKALFFTGINDGNIPKNKEAGGILSSRDREIFKEADMELAPTPREEMYSQRLYLYMNMCKPSERLVLSYAGTDREGKAMRPAYLVGILNKLFDMKVEKISDVTESTRIASVTDSYRHFANLVRDLSLGDDNEDRRNLTKALIKVYKDINAGETYKDELDAAFFEYEASALSRDIVDGIYGEIIRSSISRMEKFAQCAYAHFLQYGMNLKVPGENEFAASDLGNVYHGVLELFSVKLSQRGLDWRTFSLEEGEAIIEEAVTEFVADYEQGILSDDATRQYTIIKITNILKRSIETLQYQLKKGKLTPSRFEYPFRRIINIDEKRSIDLRGKIDRIDIYEKDGDVYVKIMDYKSSSKDIDISKVYYGIQQQLGIYMAEAVKKEQETHPGKTIHPSAMLYYALGNPIIENGDTMDSDELSGEIHKSLRMKGLMVNTRENIELLDSEMEDASDVVPVKFKKDGTLDSNSQKVTASEEEIANFLGYTERMAGRIGGRVMDGDISMSPLISKFSNACEFCNFKSICHFDEKMPGYKARDGKDVDEDTIRNTVMGGDQNGDYLF